MAPSAQVITTTTMGVDPENGEKVHSFPVKTSQSRLYLSQEAGRISWASAHFCMAILFCYCSVVQLNDPDWYLWFFGYLCAAVGCFSLMCQAYGQFW